MLCGRYTNISPVRNGNRAHFGSPSSQIGGDFSFECAADVLDSTTTILRPGLYLCYDHESNERVVLKKITLQEPLLEQESEQQLSLDQLIQHSPEFRILHTLNQLEGHPYILKYLSYFHDRECLYLVFPHYQEGDLLEHFNHRNQSLPEATVREYFHQLVEGVHYLHTHKIAHRDLSLENIMLEKNQCILIDFGFACEIPSDSEGQPQFCTDPVGKFPYMAPEVWAKTPYDAFQADVWSLGIILFTLLTGAMPFDVPNNEDQGYRYFEKHGVQRIVEAWGLKEQISREMQQLVSEMLQIDPTVRITLDEIRQHSILK